MSDETNVAQFRSQLQTIAANGMLSLSIALGSQLKLFEALASTATEASPQTAKVIAAAANCKERYVKEWLCTLACGSIIEMDKTGEKFWIRPERIADLITETAHPFTVKQRFVPLFANVFNQIEAVFRIDGPYGMDYSSYATFYQTMDSMTISMHKPVMIDKFIPLIGLQSQLESGIVALDVGCGSGFHVCTFGRSFIEFLFQNMSLTAAQFPNSLFTGIDVTADAVRMATQKMNETANGTLQNAAFIEMNGQRMPEEWTEKFDWISMFDTCHDQQRPDLTLIEIRRVLKPTGILTIVDINGSSNAYVDRQVAGMGAAFFYGVSTFHCLPVASNSEGALGLGTMWGQLRAKNLFNAAGFVDVRVVPTPFMPLNILYICKK